MVANIIFGVIAFIVFEFLIFLSTPSPARDDFKEWYDRVERRGFEEAMDILKGDETERE